MQGIHFVFPFFIAQGRGGGAIISKHLLHLHTSKSAIFFYSVAGNEQNSSIKTMVNSFTVICPQCRKRLDKTNVDIEDSPGTQAAAAYVCPPQLDEVRIRCDQRTKEVKA